MCIYLLKKTMVLTHKLWACFRRNELQALDLAITAFMSSLAFISMIGQQPPTLDGWQRMACFAFSSPFFVQRNGASLLGYISDVAGGIPGRAIVSQFRGRTTSQFRGRTTSQFRGKWQVMDVKDNPK
jgi:hypothetical protein